MATVYCAFCGESRKVESKPTTEEHKQEAIEHMRHCPEHPIRALEVENDKLRTIVELAGMLIQPTSDGPQLVGAESFRSILMLACRAVMSDAKN